MYSRVYLRLWLALLVAACGGHTSGSSDSEITTPVAAPASLAWSRVGIRADVLGQMSGVTIGGPGLVAVGYEGRAAAVWTSPDGLTWSRVPHDDAVFGSSRSARMLDVTSGGPGLVAVGSLFVGDGLNLQDEVAAVWISSDGTTWERVPHDEAVFGGTDTGVSSIFPIRDGPWRMTGVTVGGQGLVAVGFGGSPRAENAVVWTSRDGITWSRVPHDEEVFGGSGDQRIESVTAGGAGLVAVGMDDSAADDRSAAVWTSRDGISWSRVPHHDDIFAGVGDVEMRSVTTGGPGLIAVGREGPSFGSTPVVWNSVDGVSWSRIPPDDLMTGAQSAGWMESVTTGGPGLVAVGWEGPRFELKAAVWTSTDGSTWTRVRHSEAIFGASWHSMRSVTSGGPGLVAVGVSGVNAAVWVATSEIRL